MKDVSDNEGRTIIFVSHSMPMIASLCRRGIVLKNGTQIFDGTASAAVHYYQNAGKENTGFLDYTNQSKKPGDHMGELLQAWVEDGNGVVKGELKINEAFKVVIRYKIKNQVSLPPFPNFHFFDQFGQYVFVSVPQINKHIAVEAGEYQAECAIPGDFFNAGHFSIGLALTFQHSGIHVSFYELHGLNITVTEDLDDSAARSANYMGEIPGVVRPKFNWNINRIK